MTEIYFPSTLGGKETCQTLNESQVVTNIPDALSLETSE